MKNNKGFTLVEVMVALSLMAIIVASFAPLMVSSLKSVKISGDMVDEAYSAKTEMENLIALGVQNEGQQIAVDYIHQGTTEKAENVIVEGKYLSSTGTKYVKLDTFIAKDIGTISISPSSISENCSAFDTVVSITSDIIEFSDVANFRLTNKKGEVVPISDTEFKIDGNNPHNATMKIRNSSNISISQGPYKVCYNSGYAILYITPAPVIAVGNDGAYYARTDGGKWIKGKRITATSPEGKMGDRTLNDITWTGSQYICGGAYGSYFYTDDEGWQNRSSADQRDTVYDVLYSQILQKPVYAIGFKERGSVFDVKRPYTQMMSDPLEFNFAKNSGIFEIPRGGKCLTDGFIGDKEIALWAYDTYPFLNSYDGSYVSVNNINQIGGGIGSKILAMDSNRKKGPQSEFMLLTYNRIYSLKPTGNGESGGGEWKDITISASQDNQVVESTKYYYSILDYNAKNGKAPEDYIVSDVEYKIIGKQIEIDGKMYNLTSGAGKDEKSDRRQVVQLGTIKASHAGSKLSSDNFRDIAYDNDVWVLAGGNIQVQDFSSGAIISATVQKPAKWAGNGWKDNASNIEAIVKQEDFITNAATSKIIYYYNGIWHASPLPTSIDVNAQINRVEFIGDRCYAVGDKGTILSISNSDLITGRPWTKEVGVLGEISNTLTFNGVAGWGN